ncbi:MAG TPA: glycosyltransferase family 2 protein [Thermoanaerobaculia bacterium]|nr:glycosyltransferase family 2 protein [Thermoanaerobaculia bacterium]
MAEGLTPRTLDGALTLSLVIPVFNEDDVVLDELVKRLGAVLGGLPCRSQVVLVDDGGDEPTRKKLRALATADSRITLVRLARNFGHQPAVAAGLDHARGEVVVLLDGDLEDPPELIPELLARWQEGYEVVLARRRSRHLNPLRRLLFAGFYRLFELLADFPVPVQAGIYCLLGRRAWQQIAGLREANRFLPGLRAWVGFPTTTVAYDRGPRGGGAPKQTLLRLFRYASDAIFSFSYKPLRLSFAFGAGIFVLSSLYAFVLLVLRLLDVNVVSGFTTVAVAVFFFGGAMLMSNGILGEYLGRIYDEVKRRPLYVVEEVVGDDGAREP